MPVPKRSKVSSSKVPMLGLLDDLPREHLPDLIPAGPGCSSALHAEPSWGVHQDRHTSACLVADDPGRAPAAGMVTRGRSASISHLECDLPVPDSALAAPQSDPAAADATKATYEEGSGELSGSGRLASTPAPAVSEPARRPIPAQEDGKRVVEVETDLKYVDDGYR